MMPPNVERCTHSTLISWHSRSQHTVDCATHQLRSSCSFLMIEELDPVNISPLPACSVRLYGKRALERNWKTRAGGRGFPLWFQYAFFQQRSQQISKKKVSSRDRKFLNHLMSGSSKAAQAQPLCKGHFIVCVVLWQAHSLQHEFHLSLGWWWGNYLLNS